jgi:prepilin-type N-terminal cleavage/methylation domain-containing protein
MKLTGNHFPVRAARRAFSLVELMVVMTLLTLIVLALMQVFSATQRAFRASVTQTDVLEGGRAVSSLIVSDLRRMTPSDGNYPGPVNFFTLDNSFLPSTDYKPLRQALPGSTADRTNVLQYFFILSRENTRWQGIGYVVDAQSTSDFYPLYRYYAETNVTLSPLLLYSQFVNYVQNSQWTNMSHVVDGVVHLVVRPYSDTGVWMTNGYTLGMVPPPNSFFYSPIQGEVGCLFYGHTLPASVEMELGILEDHALQRAEAIPNILTRSNYLAGQSGSLQIFRQHIAIPNADHAVYQ